MGADQRSDGTEVLGPCKLMIVHDEIIIAAFKTRIQELEDAIKKHRAQKLDDRCWLDDAELYEVLHDDIKADTILPPKEEFLSNCSHYYACRQATTSVEEANKLYRYIERQKD